MTSAMPMQCSTNWAIKPTGSWGPFLESHGNLLGPISVFGDKYFLT